MALLASLVRFSHVLVGFTNRELVGLVASLLDQPYSSRQATYDLRRLRPKAHGRVLAPGLALLDTLVPDDVAQPAQPTRQCLATAGPHTQRLHRSSITRSLNLT